MEAEVRTGKSAAAAAAHDKVPAVATAAATEKTGSGGTKMKEEEDEKAENASIRFKSTSEVSTVQADSAYGSRGNSNYSSLGPVSQPDVASNSNSSKSRSSNKQLSSKSGGSSARSTQPGMPVTSGHPPSGGELLMTAAVGRSGSRGPPPAPEEKEVFDRPSFRKKAKISTASSVSAPFPGEQEVGAGAVSSSAGFNSSQESKAAKVATLSQALGYVDLYRKSQACRADKARRDPDQADLNDLAINLLEASHLKGAVASAGAVSFPRALDDRDKIPEDTIIQHEKKEGEGFCVAVSLHDGLVRQTTTSLTNILGYPKDMWVARSFIDFVHPQDKETFISQVTENICLTLRDSQSEAGLSSCHPRREYYSKSGSFFCRIRVYNSLKAGFSVKERKTRFNPFKLSVCFKDLSLESSSCNNTTATTTTGTGGGINSSQLGGGGGGGDPGRGAQSTFLFITAIPLSSAFGEPFEDVRAKAVTLSGKPSFVTKHTAACTFSPPIDEASIPYLGFLPQDMNGDDIFNYIHPLDLPLLKEAFEAAMLEQGKPVNSKLIRFRVRNGGYIQLNSWWSSFINPWSRLLEFIHGKHFVLKGPRFPDVFSEPIKGGENGGVGGGALAVVTTPAGGGGAAAAVAVAVAVVDKEELEEDSRAAAAAAYLNEESANKPDLRLQTDIRNILRRTVQRSTFTFLDAQPNSSTKAKKELSNFMGNLLEVARAETTKLGRYGGQGAGGGGNGGGGGKGGPGGHNVIAHVSTHQSDSSETPPSYNQLTYNENLTRFFNSQPKTLSEREVQKFAEQEDEEGGGGGILEEGGECRTNASSSQHKNNAANKDKKKHGSSNKRRPGGGGGGEDGGQSSAQGSRTSGDQGGHASGSGEGNGNNSSTLQTGLSAGQLNTGLEEISQDGSGSGGSRLGSGSRDKAGSGPTNPAAVGAEPFKPPALTQELLALHNRDMERRMLSKFQESRRTGDIRFLKDSPKHRLLVVAPNGGGGATAGDGGGDGTGGGINRASAAAAANMKRMLAAAMGGPDSPLHLKSESLLQQQHACTAEGGAHQLTPQGVQQHQHRRPGGKTSDLHHHRHHQIGQASLVWDSSGGSGGGGGGGGSRGGRGGGGGVLSADGSHNPACILWASSGSSQQQQHPWSAYGSVESGGLSAAAAVGAAARVASKSRPAALDGGNSSGGAGNDSGSRHGGHEGHFGYNQSNMMQRGAPTTMSGYSGLPGVPYGPYISNQRYGVVEGVPVYRSSSASCPGNNKGGPPALLHAPHHQPELPNCLAVSSCMLCHASSEKSSGRDQPPFNPQGGSGGGKKFLVGPLSRTGSRATSVKGEPGSAIESNASATASLLKEGGGAATANNREHRSGVRTKSNPQGNESDPNNCLSTTSSSLYSFLKTSEDYSGTNDSQNSSGEEVNSSLRPRKAQQAKPLLCDPFWLENVVVSRELLMTYQLAGEGERDLETVLAADRERLKTMVQPPLVYAQVKELFSLVGAAAAGGGDSEGGGGGDAGSGLDCIELAKLELEKDSVSSFEESATSADEDEEDNNDDDQDDNSPSEPDTVVRGKMTRRRSRLRKLNIFFEAEAPFPLPDMPRLVLSSEGRSAWRVCGGSTAANQSVFTPLNTAAGPGGGGGGDFVDLGQLVQQEEKTAAANNSQVEVASVASPRCQRSGKLANSNSSTGNSKIVVTSSETDDSCGDQQQPQSRSGGTKTEKMTKTTAVDRRTGEVQSVVEEKKEATASKELAEKQANVPLCAEEEEEAAVLLPAQPPPAAAAINTSAVSVMTTSDCDADSTAQLLPRPLAGGGLNTSDVSDMNISAGSGDQEALFVFQEAASMEEEEVASMD